MISANSVRIAQITDTHLFAEVSQELNGLPTAQSFQAVLQKVLALQPLPDVLLLTGDLSQDESRESYQYLRDSIAPLGIPSYWIPGNHDKPVLMAEILNQDTILPDKSLTFANWRLLLLSTAKTGCVQGYLSPQSLQELDTQLQQTGPHPVMIVLHHPPLPIHSEWMDKIMIENAHDFFTVIERYSQVKIVLFGHIHQEFRQQRQGVTYLGAPSTCVQFVPESPTLAIDEMQPGFRLLTLYSDGTWETEVQRIMFSSR
jgi:3',5'-cyclic-AMP phosphodiesterase